MDSRRERLSILYVGDLGLGATSRMRYETLGSLGHDVHGMDSGAAFRPKHLVDRVRLRLGVPRGQRAFDAALVRLARAHRPDVVWVDKGLRVRRDVLEALRAETGACLVHYNPDDPFGDFRRGWATFLEALSVYDLHLVARPENVPEYARRGARRVMPFDRGYDPRVHRPIDLDPETRARLGGAPVGFVGSWAEARARSLAHLVRHGVPLVIRGDGWRGRAHWETLQGVYRGPALWGEDYPRAINALDVALHFLRHENRDQQDSRTFEIPACGVFMLAERSPRHEALFRDGEEAVFFDTDDDLLARVKRYLDHPEERRRVAAAGLARCRASGYSYADRLRAFLAVARAAMARRVA